jgi:hypothetical protein
VSKRRSLDEALSPEEKAFLKKGSSSEKKEKSPPNPTPRKETNMSRTALKQPEPVSEAAMSAGEPPRSFASTGTGASNGAINARIDPVITTTLLRASLDRRIAGIAPHTQREIIAEALTDWLNRNGYRI